MIFLKTEPRSPLIKTVSRDVFVGIVIALVSIPISIGYALVAGLPPESGLYGSLLPIFCFSLITSSKRIIFGVDAAPAALVGGMLSSLAILPSSREALRISPAVSFAVSLFLLAFYALKANRALKFISEPVMGGFISGIGTTIILMQFPKLFGGDAGRGDALELISHLFEQTAHFSALSFFLGAGTIALILVSKKIAPKIPVQVFVMFLGAAITFLFHLDEHGVKTLPSVPSGLPQFALPDFSLLLDFHGIIVPSFSIAVVIFSETLLASKNFARKKNEKIDNRREILAYAAGNAASAISGCCPVNGSVSRSAIALQLGASSQIVSISAAAAMCAILAFGTGFIAYLPIPVLSGIVVAALLGTLEFRLASKLRKLDKIEFFIFYGAFFSVLFLGTIYGVLVGAFLSAATFMFRQARPSTDFLGVIPGMRGWYSLSRLGSAAQKVKGVVIYKFSAPLFYANIEQFFVDVIESAQKETKVIVVESSGISSVDATASERLVELWEELNKKGVRFFLAGHAPTLNAQLRAFGASKLVFERAVVPKVAMALEAAEIFAPYPLEGGLQKMDYSSHQAEFEWAFGEDAESLMGEFAKKWKQRANSKGSKSERLEIMYENYFLELAMENPALAKKLAEKISES